MSGATRGVSTEREGDRGDLEGVSREDREKRLAEDGHEGALLKRQTVGDYGGRVGDEDL